MDYPKLKPSDNVVLICGHISNPNYQRAKWLMDNIIGKRLVQTFKPPYVCGLHENEFRQQLWLFQHAIGKEFWLCHSEVLVFINGVYIGDDECFRHFLNINFPLSVIVPALTSPTILAAGKQDLLDLLAKDSARKYVFLDIAIDGSLVGRLVVRLYVNFCPKACTYFMEYARTSLEEKQEYGRPGYIGTKVHRICPPSFLQCGDIKEFTPIFSDECFDVLHNRRGVVSFSNIGPDTNKCQFIISLNPNPWMDRKYVAFGQIVEGMGVLDEIETVPTFYESPEKDIEIIDCGTLYPKPRNVEQSDAYKGLSTDMKGELSKHSWDYFSLQSVPDESDSLFQYDLRKMLATQLDETPLPVPDKVHPGDTRSDILLPQRLEAGMYSLPKEYEVFVQNMKETFRYKPNDPRYHGTCVQTGEATKQYYMLGDTEPPYAGLSVAQLEAKSSSEILHLFDMESTDSDIVTGENSNQSFDQLGHHVMKKLDKNIDKRDRNQRELERDVMQRLDKHIGEGDEEIEESENASDGDEAGENGREESVLERSTSDQSRNAEGSKITVAEEEHSNN